MLRKLEALETSLGRNAKIVIPSGTELINIVVDMAGIFPLERMGLHGETTAGNKR
jgi:hypothetical protein